MDAILRTTSSPHDTILLNVSIYQWVDAFVPPMGRPLVGTSVLGHNGVAGAAMFWGLGGAGEEPCPHRLQTHFDLAAPVSSMHGIAVEESQ